MVLILLMYSCCYGYCNWYVVKSTENLDVTNLNKIGKHVAFISPKRITIIKVMRSYNVHDNYNVGFIFSCVFPGFW